MGEIIALVEKGKKKVKITNDGYGIELYIMRNGFQWAGSGVDEEMLKMIQEAIGKYFERI